MYKKYFEHKKAAIFDLDGTVFKEAEELRKQSFEKVLEDINLSYIDPRPYCISGYPSEEVWEAIINVYEIKKQKITDLVTKTRETYLEIIKNTEIEPTEGFWDLFYELKQEKNFKICLATNTPRTTQEPVMEKLGIKNIFDVTVFRDDIRKRKPHPEIYKKSLKLLKVRSKEVVVFEDSIPGAESSVKACIDTFVIWDGVTRKSFFGDKIIEFSKDFTPYPGNLDETHAEYLVRSYREVAEKRTD